MTGRKKVSPVSKQDKWQRLTYLHRRKSHKKEWRVQRLPPGGNHKCGLFQLGGVNSRIWLAGELVDEVSHSQYTVDVARVVSEEDATERGKGTHEVGLEGDWGLNTSDIGRGGESGAPTRQDGRFEVCGALVSLLMLPM